jgi:hypothetical protein
MTRARDARGDGRRPLPSTSETPPAGLAVPSPVVLGPVRERYGIEVVAPRFARA